jgi:hypothetical protein
MTQAEMIDECREDQNADEGINSADNPFLHGGASPGI